MLWRTGDNSQERALQLSPCCLRGRSNSWSMYSVARDHLALERTFLAWLRTGLGFVALGIAIERFGKLKPVFKALTPHPRHEDQLSPQQQRLNDHQSQRDDGNETLMVGALLGTGGGCILYGTTRFFSTMRTLERGVYRPAYFGVAGLATAVAALAGGVYWSALKDASQKAEVRSEAEKKCSAPQK